MSQNIFIFHGDNIPAIINESQTWIEKFKAKYKDDFDIQIVENNKDFHIQKLILESQTVPFLCQKKLIIAKNILDKFEKEYLPKLLKVADSTILLFIEHQRLKKTDKQLSKLLKSVEVKQFDSNKQSATKIIENLSREHSTNLATKYKTQLSSNFEKDAYKLTNTTLQLIAYSKENQLTDEIFYKLTDIKQTPNIFAFLDTLFVNKQKTLQLYKQLSDHDPDPYKLLYMIIWHLKTLSQIKSGSTENLKPFIVQKHSRTAKKISQTQLNAILSHILKIDQQSKTGLINTNDELSGAIQMALFQMT
ncbi:hypothetical protein HOH51_00740 [bacterium]|jgi:DNA polymerase III delta subunit|nr:hypothetical protein [bacterium]